MKRILHRTDKVQKYIDSLPKIYIVARWARWGYSEYPLVKWKKDKHKNMIPVVYDYDDFNGTEDCVVLREIEYVTCGRIICWTMSENDAKLIADGLNDKEK